jgi:hypothetical protein
MEAQSFFFVIGIIIASAVVGILWFWAVKKWLDKVEEKASAPKKTPEP